MTDRLQKIAEAIRVMTYSEMQDLSNSLRQEMRSTMTYGQEEVTDDRVASALLNWANLVCGGSEDHD